MTRPNPRTETPAGRLLALLRTYQTLASPELGIVDTWAKVFEVDIDEAPNRIAELGSLVAEISIAVHATSDEDQMETVEYFRSAWLRPLVFLEHDGYATPSPGATLVDGGSLAALAGVTAYLSAVYPEGFLPSDDDLNMMRSQIAGLIAEVAADRSMPIAVRRLVSEHLHRILRALDFLQIGGSGAVALACEQLVGQFALIGDVLVAHDERAPVWRRVVSTTGRIYGVFRRAPEAHRALEAVTRIAGELQ